MKGKNYREFRRYGAQCDAHCSADNHSIKNLVDFLIISPSGSQPPLPIRTQPCINHLHLEADQISDSKLGGEIIDIMQNLSMTREPSRVPMG